jgi:cysteine desulfurase
MKRIFLDAQSSTPIHPAVLDAMRPFEETHAALPSSPYHGGKQARKALETASEQVAALIGADSGEEIVFTGSGTEANNLAIKGIIQARMRFGSHVLGTALDHPSVSLSVKSLETHGIKYDILPVNPKGLVSEEETLRRVSDQTILVCVPVSRPELGQVQVVNILGKGLAKRGVALMMDATTGGGWTPLDVRESNATLLSLSPHRFHGPKGIGILYKRRGTVLEPQMHGGLQASGWRAGSENVAGIVGAGMACELLKRDFSDRESCALKLQGALYEGIKNKIPSVALLGPLPNDRRLCNQLNFVFEGVEGESLMLMANVRGLECHTGITCLSRGVTHEGLADALGIPGDLIRSSLLLSWHASTCMEDIHAAIDILETSVRRLREMSPVWDGLRSGRMMSRLSLLA